MRWSLTLGTVRGIKIRIHITFLLIFTWAAYNWGTMLRRGWSWSGAVFGVILICVVFLCIVLHELAHSLVARRYGVRVSEIELSPIGGVAKMERMPERPYQEMTMALAGPAVNLVIAVLLGWLVLWLIRSGFIRSPGHLLYVMSRPSWQSFVLNLFFTNLLLALFNLLPAFPMDGGRVLRSALAWSVGQHVATRWATRVGRAAAVLLAIVGLLVGNWALVLIALVVFAGAQQEQHLTELQAILGDVQAGQALIASCPSLAPDDTLATVVELAMHGHPACFPVVVDGRLVGLLTQREITSALEAYGPQARVGDLASMTLPTLSPRDSLARAQQLMAASGLRALPVSEDGRFLGMVTARQINEIFALISAQRRSRLQ